MSSEEGDRMMEMVERVALLLTRAPDGWSEATVPVESARALAKQVITAMREPTEAMVKAGMDAVSAPPIYGETSYGEIKVIYRAMIDAALGES